MQPRSRFRSKPRVFTEILFDGYPEYGALKLAEQRGDNKEQ
jgi:hypothetical protein